MDVLDFLREVDDEVATVTSSDFKIDVVETEYVPSFDDSNITFDNLDDDTKRCKLLESCVLYVDMRDSTSISAAKRPVTLARIYSTFVRSMIAAARYHKGHVRNIIGDRVMVVFDRLNCFENAVQTATLMNTVTSRIIRKRVKDIDFRCGIGIDFGKMLIVKAGAVRRGSETEFYRSLVWLGRPANIASKLTDVAAKTRTWSVPGVSEGHFYQYINEWHWSDVSFATFVSHLKPTYSPRIEHQDPNFSTWINVSLGPYSIKRAPILMTQEVYAGLKRDVPGLSSLRKDLWKVQAGIPEYDGTIFGGDVIFTAADEV